MLFGAASECDGGAYYDFDISYSKIMGRVVRKQIYLLFV